MDGKWLKRLYRLVELCNGKVVSFSWKAKDPKTVQWNAVILSDPLKLRMCNPYLSECSSFANTYIYKPIQIRPE